MLVTGSSTGIGKDACLTIAKSTPFTCYGAVRKEADGANLVKESDGKIVPITLDVTKESDIQAAVAKFSSPSSPPLVGLVNNAGIFEIGAVEFIPIDSVKKQMEVNYFGVVRLTQALLPLLRKTQGARIVTTGSVVGAIPSGPGFSAYAATKYAIESFNDALRQEVGPLGVSASLLQPAVIKTPILTKTKMKDAKSNPEVAIYDNVYGEAVQAFMADALSKGEPPADSTTPGIIHALTSPYPKTRYASSNFGGVPAWLVKRLTWMFPDRLNDLMNKK